MKITGPRGTDTDLIVDQLWAFGPDAVEERPGDGGIEMIAGYADREAAHRAADALQALGLGQVVVDRVRWGHGLDTWRAHATVHHADPFVLIPAWLEAPTTGPGEVPLWLDPGHTFGSGSHPTTRLMLSALAGLVTPGSTALDVGCGSGILAVAAAALGAGRVVATDIDPDSPRVTTGNAVRNDVADRVEATDTPVSELASRGERYDLVLANLLAPVIAELAPALVSTTGVGGSLVMSGLLADRWTDTSAVITDVAAGQGRPVEATAVTTLDGWAAVAVTLG